MSVSVRTALQLMIDTFGAHPDSCMHCNYGNGATGRDSTGDPCELCGPQREALTAATAALARPDVLHDLLAALHELDNGYKYPTDVCAIARAAYAKAEGRS